MKYFCQWEESQILICENELFEANLKKQDIGQSRMLLDTVAVCVNVHILGTLDTGMHCISLFFDRVKQNNILSESEYSIQSHGITKFP